MYGNCPFVGCRSHLLRVSGSQLLLVAGSHLLCVEIWRADAGPFLQLLNFVSIFGFSVAPLIAAPFLSRPHANATCLQANVTLTSHSEQRLEDSVDFNTSSSDHCTADTYTGRENSTVYIAFLIVGLYCLTAAAVFACIIYCDRGSRGFIRRIGTQGEPHHTPHSFSTPYLLFLYAQFCFLILFYGGIEVGFCALVPTFAVRELGWSKQVGALVVTNVQGWNAAFTAVGIGLSKLFRPQTIIVVDVTIVAMSLILLDLFVAYYPNMLWVCSALLGIGSASIMPSAYTWANELFEITGVFNGFYWCGFFIGFMVMPALAGYMMEVLGHMWFCHVFVMCSLLVIFCFVSLFLSLNKHRTAKKHIPQWT